MSLRIRRGTEAQRTGLSTIDEGELLWVTNAQKLYVGLGNNQSGNAGMVNVGAALAGDGLAWDEATQTLKFGGANYTTDDIPEGVMAGRQYFTNERAVDAVAAALVSGLGNVQFVYNTTQDDANGGLGRIDASVVLDGIGITSVEADTTPSLGGDLDLNSHNVTGTGNVSITGYVAASSLSGASITSTTGELAVGSASSPIITSVYGNNLNITSGGISDAIEDKIDLNLNSSRGTPAVPTIVQLGDVLGGINFNAYTGTGYETRAFIGSLIESVSNGTEPLPGGVTIAVKGDPTFVEYEFASTGRFGTPSLKVGDGNATNPSIAFTTDASVDTGFYHPSDGVIGITTNGTERARFVDGGLKVSGYIKVAQVSGTLPSAPEEGMIVLDGTTFKGYASGVWVDLN